MPTVVDLFAGGGGMSLGFQQAGFEVLAAFENWDKAADTYRANFSHPVFQHDLSDVEGAAAKILPLAPDVITGGPPCQDFSTAGKGVEGERADLTVKYAQIVTSVRPKVFVMENVGRVKLSKAYKEATDIYREAGYQLYETLLDASYYGVPQKRERFFCIGVLDGDGQVAMDYLSSTKSDQPTTLRDYFGDSLGVEAVFICPRNYSKPGVFSIDNPSPTIRGMNSPIPATYKLHPRDAVQNIADTRPLTTSERAQVQTFPADFLFPFAKTHSEKIIGNAVPVKLAQAVACAVLAVLEKG